MKKLLTLCLLVTISFTSYSQTIINRDNTIYKMVNEISVLNIKNNINHFLTFHSRNNLTPESDKTKGVWAASHWAKSELEKHIPASSGRLNVEMFRYKAGGDGGRIPFEVELPVVMATLKGVNPNDDRILLVSAHIDSRVEDNNDFKTYAPGANDDLSGVTAIMEMVRIMADKEFSGTIKFMLVSGEEHGLLGAKFIAQKAIDENWNLIAMLNNDMIGNGVSSETNIADNTRLRVFSEGIPAVETKQQAKDRMMSSAENDSKSRQLARYIKEVAERYIEQLTISLVYRNDRFGRGGDHTPFLQKGITAVRLTEVNENYDRTHKAVKNENGIAMGDVLDGVNLEYVRKNAGVNLSVLSNLASAPYAPESVIIKTKGLSNKTTLTWKKPLKGVEVAGYYLLIRETDVSMWQKKILVTDTIITVPYSKDNYQFAVQSVNNKGHESIAVFPIPR